MLAVKCWLKENLPRGLQRALVALRAEWRISWLHRSGRKKAAAYLRARGLKLNIGCGPNRKRGWVNIDLFANAELRLDMREEIPLPSACSKFIYTEHFFEHLDYPDDAERFLGECHRLLESGGMISTGVPDTEWPLLEYAGHGNGQYFDLVSRAWHPGWCRTKLDHINYHFRQNGEHKFAYDFDNLREVLTKAGFERICRREFDPALDSEERREGTLYVDATKP